MKIFRVIDDFSGQGFLVNANDELDARIATDEKYEVGFGLDNLNAELLFDDETDYMTVIEY